MMVVVVTGCFNVWHFDVAVRNFDRSLINAPGPCVLFATPGMISGGFSLQVFKQWAPYEENLVTLPGYLRCYFAYRLSLVSDGVFFFCHTVGQNQGNSLFYSYSSKLLGMEGPSFLSTPCFGF